MIELTVKTLDSQNHSFNLEDDNITVAQFKQVIADRINIPTDTQRLIYCGRVLKDDIKLSEYDVNGKVVHLVQRAPPTSNAGANRPASPQPMRRNIRGFEHGMYLGSMAFPSNLMETQGIVPPPPTHSLAASRLNVARRMLRRAEGILNVLENPASQGTETTPPEEPQEEVTPVFEARVIVPNSSMNEPPIDEVLSAVQNYGLLNATSVPVGNGEGIILPENNAEASNASADATRPPENNSEAEPTPTHSASSTPDGASPASTSTENLTSEQRNGASAEGRSENTLAENASRTTEMAELLDTLGRLQVRFAPFLEQYQNFMRQDPTVFAEEARKTQAMLNRVSEILHYLGHAYHSLSDIIVRVRTLPPRPLLCRPILIQHSAVVQTGFPIQVEAQINISPDTGISSSSTTTRQTPSTAASTTQQNGGTTTTVSGSAPTAPPNVPPPHIQSHVLGLPLLPGSVHVQSFPIEIRGIPRHINIGGNPNSAMDALSNIAVNISGSAPDNNGATNAATDTANSTPGAGAGAGAGAAPTASNTTESTTTPATSTPTTTSGSQFNNPNVEFFMEVTPESITIDSLETTLFGSNQSEMLPPPPDFLQLIMQMAGQVMNRNGQQAPTSAAPATAASTTAAPTSATESATQAAQSSVNANQTGTSGQNSQARGNTQTHPTTSTHTRSTARPHVHLAQHAMQGFDPFLPCNSHHVTPRRRVQARPMPQQANQNNNSRQDVPTQGGAANVNANPIYSIVQGIVNSFRNVYRQRQPTGQTTTLNPASATTTSTTTAGAQAPQPPPPSEPITPHMVPLSTFLNMNLSDMSSGPQEQTIAQLLQLLPDETYVEGESIFTDLIMLLSRNLTIGDMMQLNNNRLEPLMRIRNELRNFFMVQVLDGTNNVAAVDRAVNRFLNEMQPFLNNLDRLAVRDDIDIVRSTQMLFRTRLPNIIALATSRNPNSLRMLVEQCRITFRQFCGLILHASANGQIGVEEVLDWMIRRYMTGMPRSIENFTLLASRSQLRQFFLTSQRVPESILQPYIVRRVDSVTSSVVENSLVNDKIEEPMELDEQEASGSSSELGAAAVNLQDDTEPIPPVEIGSEHWHNQVPADWVPIIVRDTQRQRRQNPQPAFSDAYLSGMPSKRRKIVTSEKPQGTLPQVIQESVRRAVTATGLTQIAPIETVSQAAAADINIQSAYRELLRTSVQSNLQDNEDFTPERFPNASNYFTKPQ